MEGLIKEESLNMLLFLSDLAWGRMLIYSPISYPYPNVLYSPFMSLECYISVLYCISFCIILNLK